MMVAGCLLKNNDGLLVQIVTCAYVIFGHIMLNTLFVYEDSECLIKMQDKLVRKCNLRIDHTVS